MSTQCTEVNIYMRSFGHIVWDNMVPEEIKLALTLEEFKKKIRCMDTQ